VGRVGQEDSNPTQTPTMPQEAKKMTKKVEKVETKAEIINWKKS
jgi:hypothetical protein